MIGFLLKRPVAVIMSTIAFLVLGAVAMFQLPVSLMPDVDIPEISIHYTQDNASVNEMENSITNLLRGQLQQIPSLSDITSESREGSGTITMKFEYGTSIDYAFIEVNQKVDAAMNSFPKEMQRPTIIKASTSCILYSVEFKKIGIGYQIPGILRICRCRFEKAVGAIAGCRDGGY